jgi:hypothetical protein
MYIPFPPLLFKVFRNSSVQLPSDAQVLFTRYEMLPAKALETWEGAMERQQQSFRHFLLLCTFARGRAGAFFFNFI